MHKVCVDALRGNRIPCTASHMHCTNHLYSRPSPRGQGVRQRGKCAAFLKNNIAPHRAGQMTAIYIYAPVICNHAPAPGNSGGFDFLSSKALPKTHTAGTAASQPVWAWKQTSCCTMAPQPRKSIKPPPFLLQFVVFIALPFCLYNTNPWYFPLTAGTMQE